MDISQFAIRLQNKLPKSEKWLIKRLTMLGIKPSTIGVSNFPYRRRYIPDFINYKHRYVLEIDGNIHTNPNIVRKDRIKNDFYKQNGFTLLRVKGFNNHSLAFNLKKIAKIREDKHMLNRLSKFRSHKMYESRQCY